jgi:hypothetical protein
MSKEAMKLEMVDDEGENRAVRMFLALYGGACGVTAEQMRKHLKMAGFDGAWPEWANDHNGHLTKAGAQLWIRHLFALAEQPAQLPFGVGGGLVAIKTLLSRDPCTHAHTAIQMIDAMLAEQPAQQEPVAWRVMLPDGYQFVYDERMLRVIDEGIHATRQPLYTTPPAQRKPLTDEDVKAICYVGPVYAPDGVVTRAPHQYRQELEAARLHGIRRAEAAHGIGEKK